MSGFSGARHVKLAAPASSICRGDDGPHLVERQTFFLNGETFRFNRNTLELDLQQFRLDTDELLDGQHRLTLETNELLWGVLPRLTPVNNLWLTLRLLVNQWLLTVLVIAQRRE